MNSQPRWRYTRRHRLTASSEFQRVFDRAYKSSGGGLTVLARSNDGEHPRLGMVMSSRNTPAAAVRTRVKRIIRESFRLNQMRLRGLDVVVIGRAGVGGRTNSELLASLEVHWQRLERCARS